MGTFTAHTYRAYTILVFYGLLSFTAADCECGYSSIISSASYIFTDLIETDFLHLDDVVKNSDWVRQDYNVTAEAGRGNYGMDFTIDNVIGNRLADNSSWAGPGVLPGDAGVQLRVGADILSGDFVPTAEIDSSRSDLLFGSFRASMKLTDIAGTCGAFFWYYNDSREVDIEFLSSQFDKEKNLYPVNLVMQSSLSAKQGYQDAGKYYQIANLTFDPTQGFHEYRIDFIPGQVIYYADSAIIGSMTVSTAPPSPGHLILRHWSNGNPGWSFGPPISNATMAVSYVKAYFNSSLPTRQSDFEVRCVDPSAANAVCEIPDQKTTADQSSSTSNSTMKTSFFSQTNNATNNQTVYYNSSPSNVPGLHILLSYAVMLFVCTWSTSLVDV